MSWLQLVDGIAPAHALGINSVSMMVLLPCMIITGALSDRVGRKPLLLAATVLALASAVPLLTLMHSDRHLYVQLGQLGFVLSVGMFLGAQPTLMVEEVPAAIRCTTIAIGYNVTLGIVGGLSPLVATWLVERTADQLAPAYMVMAAAVISFLVGADLPRGQRQARWYARVGLKQALPVRTGRACTFVRSCPASPRRPTAGPRRARRAGRCRSRCAGG